MKTFLILPSLLFVVYGEIIDLTHANANGETRTHPYRKTNFNLTVTHFGYLQALPTVWLESDEFFMPSHAGTHMDAPSHFSKGAWPIDQIPLNRFITPAVVIDHSERASKNPDDALTREDLLAWEAKFGRIPDGALVISRTGWSVLYHDEIFYFGNADPKKNWNGGLRYPGFSAEAAEFLAFERNIYGVGTDSISVDVGSSKTIPVHVILCAENIYLIKNIGTGVEKLPPSGATIITLPIKNKGASGAPVRMLAYWGEDKTLFENSYGEEAKPATGSGIMTLPTYTTFLSVVISLLSMKRE